jgi:leucyl-tRNA synthetase
MNELERFCAPDGKASTVGRPSSILYPHSAVIRHALETVVLLLSPLAPHIAEELWVELGHTPGVLNAVWPAADPAALARDRLEIALQLNGKFRGTMMAPADADHKALEEMAFAQPQIAGTVRREQVVKIVVVPGKLVNIVFKP